MSARVLTDVGVLPHPALSALGLGNVGAADAVVVPPSVPPLARWAARALTFGYLVGVAGGLGWLALGFLALRALARKSREPSAATAALYQSLRFDSRLSRPRLLVAERLRQPVLAGVWRFLILIPDALDGPEPVAPGRLRLSLLHELAHAEASDQRHALIGNLAGALWFFVPPLWWVSDQARLDQEFLADRRAAEDFGPLREYASSLLEFASSRPAAPPSAGAVAARLTMAGGAESPLVQRVLMLLRCPFPVEARPPAWWSWGLPALAALLTLGISSVSLRPPRPAALTIPAAHRFHVSRLETEARPAGTLGRVPLCELPVRLPEHFELTVDLWGDSDQLAATRVAGLPARRAHPPFPMPGAGIMFQDHYAIRAAIRLWVDDQVIPLGRQPPALTAWLSVQPAPNLPVRCRDLTLVW